MFSILVIILNKLLHSGIEISVR